MVFCDSSRSLWLAPRFAWRLARSPSNLPSSIVSMIRGACASCSKSWAVRCRSRFGANSFWPSSSEAEAIRPANTTASNATPVVANPICAEAESGIAINAINGLDEKPSLHFCERGQREPILRASIVLRGARCACVPTSPVILGVRSLIYEFFTRESVCNISTSKIMLGKHHLQLLATRRRVRYETFQGRNCDSRSTFVDHPLMVLHQSGLAAAK